MKLRATGMRQGRAVTEWIGKTPDSIPPASVRERIFLSHNKTCHISKREIRPGEAWHLDHVIPLWKGGENRESNMAPALTKAHKLKTAKEALERATERTKRQKVYGVKKSKNPIPGSKVSGWKKLMSGKVVKR